MDKIKIEELLELKEKLEEAILLMEEKNIKELKLECNTYGLYGQFLSIPSKGYLPLDTLLDDIYEMGENEDDND